MTDDSRRDGAAPEADATPVPVPEVLAFLAGTWHVERELRDGDRTGHFTGTAEFRPESDGSDNGGDGDGDWLHVEDGVMDWGEVSREAGRTLRLTPHADGTADVFFADGRPFHTLDLRAGRWTAVHPCAADHYEGTFTVVSPDEWHLRWDVRGPAKDQLLDSVYTRVRD